MGGGGELKRNKRGTKEEPIGCGGTGNGTGCAEESGAGNQEGLRRGHAYKARGRRSATKHGK